MQSRCTANKKGSNRTFSTALQQLLKCPDGCLDSVSYQGIFVSGLNPEDIV